MTKKKKILFIVDVNYWAYYNIAKNLTNCLKDKYDCKTIATVTEKINTVQLMKKYSDYDLYHFISKSALLDFERPRCYKKFKIFKINKNRFLNKYVSNKHITFGIYSHMYLDRKNARMDEFLKHAEAYTVSSKKLYDIYCNINGIQKPSIILTDGIDLAKFYPINQERFNNISKRKCVIGWVGNSKWNEKDGDIKGVNTIIIPAINELIAEGYQIEMNFADRNTKLISHDEMVNYYSTIDLCLCASINEGTPNPVLEAMACGVPVISTNVGIVEEALGPKQQKYILSERTKEALKDKIKTLINNSKEFKTLSKENIQFIKKWSWDYKAKDFDKFVKEVIREEKQYE